MGWGVDAKMSEVRARLCDLRHTVSLDEEKERQ
jgi:hypothetical protein